MKPPLLRVPTKQNACDKKTLRRKCSYSEFLWSVFSRIRTEYGDTLCKRLHSVQIRENTDYENSDIFYSVKSR